MEAGTETTERRRIVVIDDDPVQLKLLERTLGAQGYEVVCVDSAIGATNVVARTDPALVLLDLQMPAIDGRELCKLLRKHPRTKNLPILFLSAQSAEDLTAAVEESGADGFIEKGSDLSIVRAEVERLAGRAIRTRPPTPAAAVASPTERSRADAERPTARVRIEKRRDARHPLLAGLRLELDGVSAPITGYVSNISRGGIALYVGVRIAAKTAVRLQVPLERGIAGATVAATVRWSRPVQEMWAIGIAFDGATAEEREAVDALVTDVELATR